MRFSFVSLFVGAVLVSISSFSSDLNSTATQQTQELLRNSKARQSAINQNADAKRNDAYIRSKFNSEQDVNEAYDIAAELLPWIMEQSGGDPEKMQSLLAQAQKNPEEFYNRMPAAQRERIKQASKKLKP